MMTMAQHPQQQQNHFQHGTGNSANYQHEQPHNIKQSDYHQVNIGHKTKVTTNIANNSTKIIKKLSQDGNGPNKPGSSVLDRNESTCDNCHSGNNPEQQPNLFYGKDNIQQNLQGKRTLIKNQLYLIEQLQLENANLRNERDQLQLENEELKFQLQMISSSNILNQPGATFNDHRQLEKLVENNEREQGEEDRLSTIKITSPETTTTTTAAAALLSSSAVSAGPGTSAPNVNTMQLSTDDNKSTYLGSNAFKSNINFATGSEFTSKSLLNRFNATTLRKPMKSIHDDDDNETNDSKTNFSGSQQQQQHLLSSHLTSSNPRSSDSNQTQPEDTQLVVASIDPRDVLKDSSFGNNSLGNKSNVVLAAYNSKHSDFAQTTNQQLNDFCSITGHDDEEQLKARLVERRYGDSEKVQVAAITIQRAFRKYQIGKRFRTITEQLRHTCRSSAAIQQQSAHVVERAKRDTNNKRQLNSKNTNDQQQQQQLSSITFASGTTRAAAWESLSHAASRLAASAAAATANTKQALVNGVTKSASSQQVASSAAITTTTTTTATTTVAKQAPLTDNHNRHRSTSSNIKSDPVVAAAINFQQLESIRKRQYRVGLNIFNKNPEKGVSFLIAHSFIDTTPPYTKNSPSYYSSNQLHFVDSKQQHQQQHLNAQTNVDHSNNNNNNCQLCYEEENLKRNVAHFLLHRKGLAKERIGQYLGNLQAQFNQDVLKYYLQELDFHGLQIDIALRKFLSTLRLPGEAQKIERFVDYFANRYVQCQQQQLISSNNLSQNIQPKTETKENDRQQSKQHRSAPPTPTPDRQKRVSDVNQMSNQNQSSYQNNNLTSLSKDEIFILTFAIIMLNTDLHSPSLKPTSRMSASQFVHNLRGVFNSQTITESDLIEIYERVKTNQITTTPDHVTHVMKVQQGLTVTNFQKKELPNLGIPHRRLVCFCRLFEVYDVNKKERVGQHQREIFLFNDLLLVTKLSRRARTNAIQQYVYRHSIPLQGLHVQLFQSTYYNFGIRLCQKGNDGALIMFNARNELDQSRFVDDLTESIAEMDEMENIRAHKIVDAIHSKHQERLRRHAMLHNPSENNNQQFCDVGSFNNVVPDKCIRNSSNSAKNDENRALKTVNQEQASQGQSKRRLQSKFSSMSNLSSVVESQDCETTNYSPPASSSETNNLRLNRAFAQQKQQLDQQQPRDPNNSGTQRSCSSGSVHSLDSGFFLSRDVSPNQSG